MNEFFKKIDEQIAFNHGKNLFVEENELALKFFGDTISSFSNINEIDSEKESVLIDYVVEKAIEEFCKINQYYSFNSRAKDDLKNIYRNLLCSFRSDKDNIKTIEKTHYLNLKNWLNKTNPFAEKVYSKKDSDISPVACSEYNANLQIEILRIEIVSLKEPVLDIGCGKKGNLVRHLQKQGIHAIGIDRFTISESNLTNADWLEFNFGNKKWGTIISNLGFSNHFIHHNLREDGDYANYAKKYMDILKSLKSGGSFHYAPNLPFIEIYLDKNQYMVRTYDIGDFDYQACVITKL